MTAVDWSTFDEITRRIAGGASALSRVVPSVLADPRAYPREAMLLAAVAGLSVLLVVLLTMTVVDSVRTGFTRRRLGVHKRASARLLGLAVASAAIAVVLAGVALLPMIPGAGGSCAICHDVREAVSSWESDPHRAVSCYGCHAGRGMTGALSASLKGAGLRLSGVTSRRASVHAASCLACHDVLDKRIVGSSVRVRHRDIIESGTTCVECHPDVGHAGLDETRPSFERSIMSECLLCHDGATAPAECETCHVGGPLDVVEAPTHAVTVASGTCSDCHSPATSAKCADCHGLELPHPAVFMKRHAAMSWDDPGLCAKCHETASEDAGCRCHSTEANQHGTYEQWFPIHGTRAATTGPGGCMCHNNGGYAMCTKCHEQNPWIE